MKKEIVLIAMVLVSGSIFAQGTIVTKYFNELADNDAYTKVSVSSKMFSLFTELEAGSQEEKEFLQAVSKLKGLKVIVADSTPDAKKMYTRALKDVEGAGYEELMSVQDADNENLRFSIKEKGGKIEELLMVAGGGKKFVLLSLYGEIDLKNISKLARSMKVDGLEQLEKIGDDAGNKN